jgi:hypothetical protein
MIDAAVGTLGRSVVFETWRGCGLVRYFVLVEVRVDPMRTPRECQDRRQLPHVLHLGFR